jgi:hypothetical protein
MIVSFANEIGCKTNQEKLARRQEYWNETGGRAAILSAAVA